MAATLGSLAELIGADVAGDPERRIEGLRTLEEAGPADLSFLARADYFDAAVASRAAALLVGEPYRDRGEELGKPLLVAAEPKLALARLLDHFAPAEAAGGGVHPTAVVAGSASIGDGVEIGAHAVIGEEVTIGADVRIGAHGVIGDGVEIGDRTRLHPRVTVYGRCRLGRDCIVHAGAVIGADGYGYATVDGRHVKLRHLGRVVIGDEVEIGANSTIDRGLLGDTVIGGGTKIDDLVMVAHNVRVGRGCLLVAQAGIAGSSRLGDHVTVAGQSGIIGHAEIGDGVVVAAKSAVFQDVEAGRRVGGIPAVDLGDWRRQQAVARRLTELRSRLRELERRLGRPPEGETE